jgi:hypothetical protein
MSTPHQLPIWIDETKAKPGIIAEPFAPPTIHRTARFTKSGDRRFLLTRRWGPEDAPYVCFVMLNPSTANAEHDDPTIRKCMKYVRTWGYTQLRVVNLWDYITPNPHALLLWTKTQMRPEERNHPDQYLGLIGDVSHGAALTVCGWGTWGTWFPDRVQAVLPMLKQPHALHLTKCGQPGHPLYLPGNAQPVPYQLQ